MYSAIFMVLSNFSKQGFQKSKQFAQSYMNFKFFLKFNTEKANESALRKRKIHKINESS